MDCLRWLLLLILMLQLINLDGNLARPTNVYIVLLGRYFGTLELLVRYANNLSTVLLNIGITGLVVKCLLWLGLI